MSINKSIFSVLIYAISASPALVQESMINTGDTLEFYQSTVQYVVENSKREIFPYLTSNEKDIADKIEISVIESWSSGAFAYENIIEIHAGIAVAMDQLSLALFADYKGFSGCLSEYGEYMLSHLAENTSRVKNGQNPVAVAYLMQYAQDFNGYCTGFDWSALTEDDRSSRANSMNASMLFLYLHELGHHVLGHVEGQPDSLQDSRADEAAADEWAVKKGLEAGFDMGMFYPMMLYLTLLGDYSIEDEIISTHPLGIRRLRDNYLVISGILREQGETDIAYQIETSWLPKIDEIISPK